MGRQIVIALVCVFVLVGGLYATACDGAYSDAVIKQTESLKADADAKKDMPESLPGIKLINGQELKEMVDAKKNFVLIDNRDKEQFTKEHITGAVLITVDELIGDPKLSDKLDKNVPLVLYCNGIKCWRSPGAALLYQSLGFKEIYWYRSGLPEWIKLDFPTVKDGK
ncbi:MAG: rhodanese-like domain-containing protein [Thermoleophilia bacterium]